MKSKSLICLVLILVIAGCSAKPIYEPHKIHFPDDHNEHGYEDEFDSEHDIYTAKFWAGSLGSVSGTKDAAMYRAADLTVQRGADYFTVVQDSVEWTEYYTGYVLLPN